MINENFMKAFALACMFLIGMISFTGFGNTTTDPATDSETVEAFMATPVSVAITVSEMEANSTVFEIGALSSQDYFEAILNGHVVSRLASNENVKPFKDSEGDVLLFYNDAKNSQPKTPKNYRSPRDAISCRLA